MNKFFLKVFMPLLFLQVMFVVSTSAQTLSPASSSTPRTTASLNTTITIPANPAPTELVISRLELLTDLYGQQMAAAAGNSALYDILDAKASSCKQIMLNLMDGMSVANAVTAPYNVYVSKKIQANNVQSVAQFQEFKGSVEAAIAPKN